MKKSTLPPLRVESSVRSAAESVLREGETLSSFVLESVQMNIARRSVQREFIERGLRHRDEAKAHDRYITTDEMLARLDGTLNAARDRQKVTSN
ncbi:MAG: YlcI/YnfO family protein [Halothiobacillus sp.]